MDKTEMLARMWIKVDPNRGGTDPDELLSFNSSSGDTKSALEGKPAWHWFISRAEGTLKYLEENGYEIVKKAA